MKSTEGELIKLPFLKLLGDTISKTEKETRVNAEKNKLFPTETGKIVNRFLEEQFPELLDYSLTANIEDSLDLVASNRRNWRQVVGDTFGIFTDKIQSFSSSETRDSEKYKRELGDPSTGDAIKVYIGKYGPVIARTGEMALNTPLLKMTIFARLHREGNSADTIPKDCRSIQIRGNPGKYRQVWLLHAP